MKIVFKAKTNAERWQFHKTTKYSIKGLADLIPKIWNQLLADIKRETIVLRFKEYIIT